MSKSKSLRFIEELFDSCVFDMRERDDEISFVVSSRETTFDDLFSLSEAFGTRHINFGSKVRESGYCDTCRHSYAVTPITISKITRKPV